MENFPQKTEQKEEFLRQQTSEEQKFDITSGNPKTESYDFSLEFSKHGRKDLAREIKLLRRKYREDIPTENDARSEKRDNIAKEQEKEFEKVEEANRLVFDLEQRKVDYEKASEELEKIKGAIEKKKSSLWYKIQRRLKHDLESEEVMHLQRERLSINPEYFYKEHLEDAKEKMKQREIYYEYRKTQIEKALSEAENIIIDEGWHDKARARITEFYKQQNELRNEFENDKKERSISNNSEKHNVLFFHGVPINKQSANTGENSAAFNMSGEDRIRFLLGINPAISVSTKRLDYPKNTEQEPDKELMYPTGLILGKGEILSAYKSDALTDTESFDIKRARHGGTSAIQPNIGENIEKAIQERNPGADRNWNEFIVQNEEPCGLFILEETENYEDALAGMRKLSEDVNLPIIHISGDGKLFNLTENKETTREEVLNKTKKFSVQERINLIEQTKDLTNRDPMLKKTNREKIGNTHHRKNN
jgi:hypothetical protein